MWNFHLLHMASNSHFPQSGWLAFLSWLNQPEMRCMALANLFKKRPSMINRSRQLIKLKDSYYLQIKLHKHFNPDIIHACDGTMLISCTSVKWLAEFSAPKLATILLTYSCDNNCIFCGPATKRQPSVSGNMDSDLVFEWIDRCSQNGVKIIVFSGAADPVAHPDIESFIKRTIALGIRPYSFTTAKHCSKEKVHSLYESGLHEILVSIHGHNPKIHEAATRTIGSYSKTLHGMNNLQSAGFRIQTNTVISSFNINFLSDIIDFLIDQLNVDALALSYPRFEGNAILNRKNIPSYADVAAKLLKELPRIRKKGKPVTIENIPPCHIPYSEYCPMPDYPIMYKDLEYDVTVRPSEVEMYWPSKCDGCRIECPGIDQRYPYGFLPGVFRD